MSMLLKFSSYSAVRRTGNIRLNRLTPWDLQISRQLSSRLRRHENYEITFRTLGCLHLHTYTRCHVEMDCNTTHRQFNPDTTWNGPVYATFLQHSDQNIRPRNLQPVPSNSQLMSTETKPNGDEKKNKKSLLQRVKTEIIHYYHGFRLLGLEMKIASGICFRLLGGHTLTRRERKQLVRTVADIIRLVPFAVFIIVPFMEFLLPVYLKFFPFMLPSTFKDKSSEAEKIRQRLKAKLEMTRFLQETLQQTSGSVTSTDDVSTTFADFQAFLQKVQTTGQQATIEDISRFSKLFEDSITLDSLELKQLKMLCRLLLLPTMGPSNLLRFQIWMRVRQLKAEDRLIAKEGVDELPTWELQTLCQERGMKSAGLTEERLRSQLSQWLTLHLEKNVPVTLLLFSRALSVLKPSSGELPLEEAIAQLPPSASEEITARVLETTPVTELDPRTKIDVLRKEQASIKAARAQREQELAEQKLTAQSGIKPTPPDQSAKEELVDRAPVVTDNAPTDSAAETSQKPSLTPEKEKLEIHLTPSTSIQTPDVLPISDHQSIHKPAAPTESVSSDSPPEKYDEPEISVEDLTQIETAIAESSDVLNEETLDGLKDEVAETVKTQGKHEASLVASETDKQTSKVATRLAARVSRLIGEMDTLVNTLTEEKEHLLDDIKSREVNIDQSGEMGHKTAILDAIKADQERVVDINDLLQSLCRIQQVPNDSRWEKILKILDEDHDGKIELKHVLAVIELLGSENVKLSSKEVTRVLEMLDNEASARSIESASQNQILSPDQSLSSQSSGRPSSAVRAASDSSTATRNEFSDEPPKAK